MKLSSGNVIDSTEEPAGAWTRPHAFLLCRKSMALKKQLLDAFVLDNHIQVICIGISNVDVGHIHAPCPCLQRCDISCCGGEIFLAAGGLPL